MLDFKCFFVSFIILDKLNQSHLMPNDIIVNIDDFKQNFMPPISKKDLEYFNRVKSNYSVTSLD